MRNASYFFGFVLVLTSRIELLEKSSRIVHSLLYRMSLSIE